MVFLHEYVADFETKTTEPTEVWLWGVDNLECTSFEYGNDIDSFMDFISLANCKCYFHNLKFDGGFILSWLFRNGYSYTEGKLKDKEFTTLISDMGQWYKIVVNFGRSRVTFLDSLKLIPLPVESIPKAYGLPIKKLSIDYSKERNKDYIITSDEITYVKHDVHVVAMALKINKEAGMKKITVASNALADFKNMEQDNYKHIFPELSIGVDKDCRLSYKGGWTYVNPEYAGKMVGNGCVYDVNSMYPAMMKYKKLPYGLPVYYTGRYEDDEVYPLYIQNFEADIKIKPGKYPSLQLKHSIYFNETEYITETNGVVTFCLTSVDFTLMLENYDILYIKYLCGYKFHGAVGLFSAYVDKWYAKKEEADRNGNKGYKQVAKLYLNSLYGKEGSNPIRAKKIPIWNSQEQIVKYKRTEPEEATGGYVPVASFITSYARDTIIRAANNCGDRFVYADTDSLHIIGDEEPDIDIDEYRLGAFKLESRFKQAKFLRPKAYIEETLDGDELKLDKKLAGLPKNCRGLLTFETLKTGQVFKGKLMPRTVKGGVILEEKDFKIR